MLIFVAKICIIGLPILWTIMIIYAYSKLE